MELIERPNLDAVYYLNSISFNEYKNDCIKDAEENGKKKPDLRDIEVWFNNIKQFCATNIKTKGITKRIYSYSQHTPAGLGGRLFCGGSLQGIWGKYRGLLLRGIATDIDMVNCHPVLLRYICNKHSIKCTEVEYYIKNRDKCLAEFPSRSAGKQAYLVSTNSDKILRGKNLPTQLKLYDKQMKEIQKQIDSLTDYKELRDTIPIDKKDNRIGSSVNRVLCYYENIALQHAIHILNKNGIELAVPMFDGCIPYGNHYDNPDLLKEIETYVEEQMPDLNMKWAYKEHDATIQIPGDFDPEKAKTDIMDYTTWGLSENQTIVMKVVFDSFKNNCSATDVDLAKLVQQFAGNKYVCSSIKNSIWYEFTNHRWKQIDSGSSIRPYISETIRDVVLECVNKVKFCFTLVPKDTEDYNKLLMLLGEANGIYKSFGNTNGLKNVMLELKYLYYKEKFVEGLDTNPFLLCCSNGVFDFKTKTFRDGVPEDMLSLSTNIPYVEKEELDSDAFLEVMDFITKIMPYTDLRIYFLEHLSSCLIGTQQHCPFTNYTGVGSNGKSKVVDLMSATLGDYAGIVPVSLLTSKRQSVGGASPEIASLRGVRYAVMAEPSKQDVINEGVFKEYTGDESKLTGRQLYGDVIVFKPQFKLVLTSNYFMNIKSNDDGTWRRIGVVEFHSKFSDADKLDPENEFNYVIDRDIGSKMKNWAVPFLCFLIQNACITDGKVEKNEMVESITRDYRIKQDRVSQFIADNIIVDKNGAVSKTDLGACCDEWFKTNYKYTINNREVFETLERDYDLIGGFYRGFKLKLKFGEFEETKRPREDVFCELFDRYFEITNNKKDFIKSIRISEWAKVHNLLLNTSKTINPVLKEKYGLDVNNKEHYKVKKVEGIPVQCWVGIVEKSQAH
jgi:P4 family phage/plasmid primase-like protien